MTIEEIFSAISNHTRRATAFKALQNRYDMKFISRWRRWGASTVDCDDLLQELRLRLLAHPGLGDIKSPHAYLWRMHESVYIDRRKWQARGRCRKSDQIELLELAETRPSPAATLEWEDQLSKVCAHLQRRSPRMAEAIKCLVLELTKRKWSRTDTMRVLHVGYDVAKSLIAESRRALARSLRRISRTPASRQPIVT